MAHKEESRDIKTRYSAVIATEILKSSFLRAKSQVEKTIKIPQTV